MPFIRVNCPKGPLTGACDRGGFRQPYLTESVARPSICWAGTAATTEA
jgi:hypothetical protein